MPPTQKWLIAIYPKMCSQMTSESKNHFASGYATYILLTNFYCFQCQTKTYNIVNIILYRQFKLVTYVKFTFNYFLLINIKLKIYNDFVYACIFG